MTDEAVTELCTPVSYYAYDGYLATPNFPHEYPANLDCACSMQLTGTGAHIQLEATHFIIKYDQPCQDWVSIHLKSNIFIRYNNITLKLHLHVNIKSIEHSYC